MQNTIKFKDWNIETITGYKPITTFYMDFSIADEIGNEAVEDTYRRAFEGWKDNIKYITELFMVLNWKIWEHYETDEIKARVYNDLYHQLGNYIDQSKDYTTEEKNYFYRTID